MCQKFFRAQTLPVEKILPLLGESNKADERTVIAGIPVHVTGLRLATFKHRGIVCVECGVEGQFFAFERAERREQDPFHLNLYAIKEGVEVIMTHDHKVSRANGGADNISNSQTMCGPCNWEKGRTEKRNAKA